MLGPVTRMKAKMCVCRNQTTGSQVRRVRKVRRGRRMRGLRVEKEGRRVRRRVSGVGDWWFGAGCFGVFCERRMVEWTKGRREDGGMRMRRLAVGRRRVFMVEGWKSGRLPAAMMLAAVPMEVVGSPLETKSGDYRYALAAAVLGA